QKEIGSITVTESPRLPYRGMMIDVSRHFHDKDFILKQIDAMASLKLNNLHLHLTDGAGWRLEIQRYPRLSKYAAWRPQRLCMDWEENGKQYCDENTPGAYGGYFTRDDIKEIVDYAADRYINVIPEIEMPAHSEEVIAAYPELNCTGASGSREFCPGNEATFEFIENVLDEVMEMFPSQYIHVGGDEANKSGWRQCDRCAKRMADEGISDPNDLQNYLICRVGRYLRDHGRTLLGWDELLEGNGFPEGASVMVWRDPATAEKAARDGHDVILTPSTHCYLDYYQDAPPAQPIAFGGYIPAEMTYSYDPVPPSLPDSLRRFIKGLQGNLWCEWIPTDSHAEYMLYPRMIAIAEAAWSPQELRSWDTFKPRMTAVADRMRANGYNTYDITTEAGNRAESRQSIDHLAKGCQVTYNLPWWNKYTAGGATTLTDGLRGGWAYQDKRWQGFFPRGDWSLDVTIDLGASMPVGYIGADFMQRNIHDVWMPDKVVISVSDNGTDFTTLQEIPHIVEPMTNLMFKNFYWTGSTKARYVRYQAHAARGVLFTDEIVVLPSSSK
ncbi:MAG: family 20 glycosylhydrolase, partial [Muribaculaceae bacterium]|nr:family 20 glycosylhydrolase [Muribaculaceae bacterium]